MTLLCLHAPAVAAVAAAGGGGASYAAALALVALAPVASFFASRGLAAPGEGAPGEGAPAIDSSDSRTHDAAPGAREAGAAAPDLEARAREFEGLARELGEKNRDLRLALDNLGRGLVAVAPSGDLASGPSAALAEWFGPASPGGAIWDYLGRGDEPARDWLRLGWEELTAGVLPLELAIDQLPTRLERGGRSFRLDYRSVSDGEGLGRVLLIVSDVTAEVERERDEAEQREALHMAHWVATDRAGFAEFLDEGSAIVGRLAGRGARAKDEQLRLLHTLKGNSSLFGLAPLATLCHALEGRVVEATAPLPPREMGELAARWEATAARANALLGARTRLALELDEEEYEALRSAVARSAPKGQVLNLLDDLRREPVARRLERVAEQTRVFARRLGKEDVVVRAESNRLRLPSDGWAGFWSALAHAVRNALDHGIEPPAERRAAGKAGAGGVTLRTRPSDEPDFVDVEVEDDGRGVDWERVRRRAAERGLPCATREDLHEALFHDGLSTKDGVDESSGRGAGMSALRAACEQLGGSVRVWSEPGQGTRVRARLPLRAEASPVTQRKAQPVAALPSWAQDAGPLSRFATIDGSAFRR